MVRSKAGGEQASVLAPGDAVEIATSKMHAGNLWVRVATANGVKGWIAGDTRIFIPYDAVLEQKEMTVIRDPYTTTPPIATLHRGEKFSVVETHSGDGKGYVRIRLKSGAEGYVHERFKARKLPRLKTRELTMDLIWGLGFVGLAVLFSILPVDASMASNVSSARWICLGFGLIKLAGAAYQYFSFRNQR